MSMRGLQCSLNADIAELTPLKGGVLPWALVSPVYEAHRLWISFLELRHVLWKHPIPFIMFAFYNLFYKPPYSAADMIRNEDLISPHDCILYAFVIHVWIGAKVLQ